jgi:flagellin
VSLTQTNSDITKTQGRLASGLAVASASDDISVYFKAQSYTNKASDLDSTNKGISQAVANLDTVDKAISNMQDNLKGALQLMKDARAKAVTVQKAATTAGDQSYNTVTVGAGPTARTLKGDIVQAKALNAADTAAKADSSAYFQVGDVFAVTLADATSGQKVTKYFRATDPTAAVPTTAVDANGNGVNANGGVSATPALANGSTYNQALNFNDLETLGNAMQNAFGLDNITMNLATTGTGAAATYKLGFTLTSTSSSLAFAQVNDQAVGTGSAATGTDPGAAFDFSTLFGKLQSATTAAYNVAPTPSSDILNVVKGTTPTPITGSQIFAAVGGAANNADAALQARVDAANFFRQTLYGLDNMTKDASLPGYANLLKGEQMTVNLNDVGDVRQVIQLAQKADPNSLGFVGYTVSGTGQVNTAQTQQDFRTDGSLDTSITQANNAIVLLKQIQTTLAAAKTAMNSRLDYNKSMVTTLNSGATDMTAADSTAEAANLAALQNRQAFATNNMALTKQAEQSLIQLLR